MTSSSQMSCFLNTNNISVKDTQIINNLKKRINDLIERLIKSDSGQTIPVLPEGGGSSYKVGLIALPNIKHMEIVFDYMLRLN
jgi:hypothetical protein